MYFFCDHKLDLLSFGCLLIRLTTTILLNGFKTLFLQKFRFDQIMFAWDEIKLALDKSWKYI